MTGGRTSRHINQLKKVGVTGTISLAKACEILSISQATGRNWIKSGLLCPLERFENRRFCREEIFKLRKEIKGNRIDRLNKRRNKKHISGKFIPTTYLKDRSGIALAEKILGEIKEELTEPLKRVILAEYALKFFHYRQDRAGGIFLSKIQLANGAIYDYIKRFLSSSGISGELLFKILNENPSVFEQDIFPLKEDVLGLLYMSLSATSKKKRKGAYYTPTAVVTEMIDKLDQLRSDEHTIIDPCCGTGNFLIELIKKGHPFTKIFGCDIDELSIFLARINVIIFAKVNENDYGIVFENIKKRDSLRLINRAEQFDICVGNPPWGSELDADSKIFASFCYETFAEKGLETFGLFIELGLKMIKDGGYLSYIVPDTFFNVKSHAPIRKLVSRYCKAIDVRYWENIFDGVLAPALSFIMKKEKTASFGAGAHVITAKGVGYTMGSQRAMLPESWSFNISDEQLNLISKLEKSDENFYLKSNAEFALGIVTGNNKKFLKSDKRSEDYSAIIRGSDIVKFKVKSASSYILYEPGKYQQVANNNLYFAREKLLYRFIADTLVFAYDNAQTLSLNSANMVVPRLEKMPMKYILGILNSKLMHFYFKLKFSSIKILRSHLEMLPLRDTESGRKQEIIDLVDKLIGEESREATGRLYAKLNGVIYEAYDLSDSEIELVANISDGNLFLR